MANVSIDNLASEIMKGLQEYKDLATADMKTAVRKAGKSVKKDIQANAPKKTGAYSKSWSVKTTKETSDSLELTVYSPKKYQLAPDLRTVYIQIFTLFKFDKNLKKYNRKTTLFIVK